MQIIGLWCSQLLCFLSISIKGAVLPPPWANPKINPCATQPRGWQLLYWPPDGKCYKIFQVIKYSKNTQYTHSAFFFLFTLMGTCYTLKKVRGRTHYYIQNIIRGFIIRKQPQVFIRIHNKRKCKIT